MIRRVKALLLAMALIGMRVMAADAPPSDERCVDRAAEAASAPVVRLKELRYRCLALRGGQHVLVGEAGRGQPHTVLLVHGLGNNAHRDWATVLAPLAAQFHVVALDLPGFGASPGAPQGYSFQALSKVLAEVLSVTAPGRRVHVVGHSLGGAVSLHFAHAHADRVERLVLVDAAGILLKTVFVQHIASLRARETGIAPVDRLLQGLSERVNAIRRGVFRGLDDRFDFSRWLAQNPGVRNALLGRYTQVEAGLGLVEHDFGKAIRETAAPTTVIWGAQDPIAPLRTGRLLAARLPDARLKVIDGAGHTPMLDSPDAFRALLLEALAAPLAPRYSAEASGQNQGHVVCKDQADRRYSRVFDSLTLDNCQGVRIERARLGQLVLQGSSATLDDSVVEGADVALSAQASELTATNLRLGGHVAVRAEASRLDLAGASLQARERGIEATGGSRVYFSVSDLRASDYTGDIHDIWPLAAGVR